MITVLFILPHSDGYGADLSILTNIVYLKKIHAIYPIIILFKSGRIEKLLNENQIEYYVMDFKMLIKGYKYKNIKFLKPILKKIYNYLGILKVINKIRSKGVNIVHTNSLGTDIGIKIAKILKIRHIQHIREILKEGFDFELEIDDKHYYKMINLYSDAILVNSYMAMEKFKGLFPKEKLIFIPNPIFERKNELKNCKRYFNRVIKFLVVARLMPDKGIMDIFNACLILKEKGYKFQLDFYGEGYLMEELLHNIRDNGLEGIVNLKGYSNNLQEIIPLYDVGILNSKMETFGRAIVEYMLSGLSVICTKTCGASYLIKNNYNGFLFEFGDVNKLAEIMSYYIEDSNLSKRLGNNAFNTIDDTFTIQHSSLELLKVYEKTIEIS
jgi:glycosyltransferase involved in cell wall biosynthesis